jgi:glycerophosphoryl diester phosphodiesterase
VTTPATDIRDLLLARPFAHRGLWAPKGPPENSLAAFAAACAAGYGIEFDVRLSANGEAMVFHDAELKRMTGAPGYVVERTATELAALRLARSDQPIPTLEETLKLVDGRALLLVELKTDPGAEGPLEQRVAELLGAYDGPAAVIGFNPLSHAWFAEHRPEIMRGLNLERLQYAETAVAEARPHFLLPAKALTPLKGSLAAFRSVVWTVRTLSEARAMAKRADNIIFEGFRPGEFRA